jgi:hypothetical protein
MQAVGRGGTRWCSRAFEIRHLRLLLAWDLYAVPALGVAIGVHWLSTHVIGQVAGRL